MSNHLKSQCQQDSSTLIIVCSNHVKPAQMKTNTVFDLTHIDTHGLCVTPYSNTVIPMWAVFTGIPLMESEHIHMLSLYLGHIATLVYSKLIINQEGLWTLLIYLLLAITVYMPLYFHTCPWHSHEIKLHFVEPSLKTSVSWVFLGDSNLTIRVPSGNLT